MAEPEASPSASEVLSVDEVARLVEQFSRKSGFERRCKIGETIFKGIFASRRVAWRGQGTATNPSFREVARRLHGRVSKSELHRSVRTYLLTVDLPFVPTSGHLTVSHTDAIEGLARSEQEKLLRLCEEHRWSVRKLRDERRLRTEGASAAAAKPRGRPRAPALQIAYATARRVLGQLDVIRGLVERENEADRDGARLSELGSCVRAIRAASEELAVLVERAGGSSSQNREA